ncbi:MAG: GNAT family N-acetyltransferase [bacterium]
MEIREANPNDYSDVTRIWFEASILAYPFIELNLLEDVARKLEFEHLPKTKTFVAINNDLTVGFISTIENFIAGLFVHPNYQGMGIGTSLINYIRPAHDELSLNVFKKNIKAQASYNKYGFVEIANSVHEETGEIQLDMKLVNNKKLI